MTSPEYDRGLEDGAQLAHRDAFVLVHELRIENERLRAVLAEQHQANAALTIVNTRLEAEKARLRDDLAAIAAHNPYPAEVFTPLTAEEQGLISAALRDSGVRNPLDRTYADWGRHIGRQYADLARRALGTKEGRDGG